MRILYVSSLYTSYYELLYQGGKKIKGMPAFFRVLEKLINDGHQVDIILYDGSAFNRNCPLNIQLEWLSKVKIIDRLYASFNISCFYLRPLTTIQLFFKIRKAVKRACENTAYDLIYGHGSTSEAANNVAKKYGIPFGSRQYGDRQYSYIKKYGALIANAYIPFAKYSYRKPKAFMIATNDGSQVDKLYHYYNKGRSPFPLYFWLNGYPEENERIEKKESSKQPFLLYVARITRWKQQHLAIELIHILKERGVDITLEIVGQIAHQDYYNKLCQLISKYNIGDRVKFVGALELKEIQSLIPQAIACLSFYDGINLGNAFIEYISGGGITISLNDGSLDILIKHAKNGFLVHDMKNAADIVEQLIAFPEKAEQIRNAAIKTAREKIKSWDQRVQDEIDILKYFARKQEHK